MLQLLGRQLERCGPDHLVRVSEGLSLTFVAVGFVLCFIAGLVAGHLPWRGILSYFLGLRPADRSIRSSIPELTSTPPALPASSTPPLVTTLVAFSPKSLRAQRSHAAQDGSGTVA